MLLKAIPACLSCCPGPLPRCSVQPYEGTSGEFEVGPRPSSQAGGGLWQEVKHGLAVLGRRAGFGGSWLLRSLQEP